MPDLRRRPNPARLDIGRAHPDDAGEIIALQRAAYRIEAERYDDFGLPPLTETADEFVAALDTHTVLVARRRDGEPSAPIVGTARARVVGDTAHIARLSVLPCAARPGHRTPAVGSHRA